MPLIPPRRGAPASGEQPRPTVQRWLRLSRSDLDAVEREARRHKASVAATLAHAVREWLATVKP